jgi:deoxyribonuclease-4
MHLNDTHVELGSRRDRHANIGTGKLGEESFRALLRHPALAPLGGIIETPAKTIEDDIPDIEILKRLRDA